MPLRSIPAHTGEPRMTSHSHSLLSDMVYPRAYGGTHLAAPPDSYLRISVNGLSPRIRGNPDYCVRSASTGGSRSIPAHTGEPAATLPKLPERPCKVYPRAYGGTCIVKARLLHGNVVGLSPRIRGNPCPQPIVGGLSFSRVYPRAYGGTHVKQMHRGS